MWRGLRAAESITAKDTIFKEAAYDVVRDA